MTAGRVRLLAALLLVAATVGAQAPPPTLNILPLSLPVGGGAFVLGQTIPVQQLSTQFPNDQITWSVSSGSLPPGLTLGAAGSASGPISSITGTTSQAGAFTFIVSAFDLANGGAGSRQYTIFVSTGFPLSLTTLPHPGGVVGNAYSTQTFQVGGGVPGYTWALQPGTTADGLTLDSRGALSGVPVAGGIFPITVVAGDASGAQVSSSFNLNILGIATASLPSGAVGSPYSQALAVAGGTGPFSWSLQSGALAPGLTLSPQGQISGTPTGSGTFSFQALVTDSVTGFKSSSSLSVTIAPNLTITTTSLPNGTVGTPYPTQTLAATGGGQSPLSWSLSSGTLPPGLTLSSLGQISGTPNQAGTFAFQVTVSDSVVTATQSLSITITTKLTVTTTSPLPNGVTGVVYSQTLQGSGGAPPYRWSASGVPAGLTLNSNTGILSGTPTAAGSSTISVTLTDAVQGTATAQFTLIVNTPSVVISGLPLTGVAATQSAATVSLIGGTYPVNLTGTLTLGFAPAGGGAQLFDAKFASGPPTTAAFAIPAGASQGLFGAATSVPVMIGTVAGTITITTSLQDSSGNTLPPPAPIVIVVDPTVPVITNVTPGTVTGSGFTISVTGYSSPRDMTSALFHFTSPTNTQLTSADITVPLTSAFTTWYSSAASNPFGSQFNMTVQFSFNGPPGTTVPFTTVSVTLTNSRGTSTGSAPVSP